MPDFNLRIVCSYFKTPKTDSVRRSPNSINFKFKLFKIDLLIALNCSICRPANAGNRH